MTTWIDKSLVIAIHDRQVAEFGGTEGIREESLLESAIARPQQLAAYGNPPPDLAALAASLAFGLARNHAFVDGNKRTAHVCYRTFLRLNGLNLIANLEDKFIMLLALAEGRLDESEFAVWLRSNMVPEAGSTTVHEGREGYSMT